MHRVYTFRRALPTSCWTLRASFDALILYCLVCPAVHRCCWVKEMGQRKKSEKQVERCQREQGNHSGGIFPWSMSRGTFFRSATCLPPQRTNEKRNVRFSRVIREQQSGVDSQSVCVSLIRSDAIEIVGGSYKIDSASFSYSVYCDTSVETFQSGAYSDFDAIPSSCTPNFFLHFF